jgi:hypothetical protein
VNQGELQRFNAGSMKGNDAKYAKFAYSTQFPFNVGMSNGMPSPDGMLCLIDGIVRGQRTRNRAFAVNDAGWLRVVWEQDVNGFTHTIETVIVVLGEQHIRAHRLQLSPKHKSPLKLVEGGWPLGYSAGEVPIIRQDDSSCTATLPLSHATGIYNIFGYEGATLWQGAPHINSVYPYDVLPVLTVDAVSNEHELLCLVHGGNPIAAYDVPDNAQGIWQRDGKFRLIYGTLDLIIPSPE